jgi:hypothetical protein
MNNGRAIGMLLALVQPFLASCGGPSTTASWGSSLIAERALGSNRTLSLCRFDLVGAGDGTIWHSKSEEVGGYYTRTTTSATHTDYPNALATSFIQIYETSLRGAGAFTYVPTPSVAKVGPNGFGGVGSKREESVDVMVKESHLHACLMAFSVLEVKHVKFGWHKNVGVVTKWYLWGQSGWKLQIETDAVSADAQGVFPDPADPKLQPVFLELARNSVEQLLAKLAKEGMLPPVAPPAS